ncbi:hypothetical protein S7335_3836 [Synechococcus sp. PCC 7335]|nr:hypothetical protein S7335_3836 [Synechococcus sp. PCC 7335]
MSLPGAIFQWLYPMVTYRTVILEAHDGSRWRSLSQLPTCGDARLNHFLLWENPSWPASQRKANNFPPLPEDCSERVKSRLKGLAYYVTACLKLAEFKAGVEQVARGYKEHSLQVMTEMRGAIAMAQVLTDGNIPVRFIILLDY